MIATDEPPAEYSGYRPGVVLSDREHRVICTLPIGAWPQVRAWHRDPAARPLLIRDEFGSTVSIAREFVAQIERRDLDSVVTLEHRERERAAQWSEE